MKVFLPLAMIFALGLLGLVVYNVVNGGRSISSNQTPLQYETPPINPATITNNAPQTTIPYKEGYDPVTGRPFVKQDSEPPTIPYKEGYDPVTGRPFVKQDSKPQEPITYGTPPVQESYPEMNEDYPYAAKLPIGTEGKIKVVYNYVVEFPQRYLVNIEVTNLSNRPLEKFYYNTFLKNGVGNILQEVRDEGHHNAPPRFPLQPGDSTVLKTSKTSVEPGFGGETAFETWKVEIEVTYVRFQ